MLSWVALGRTFVRLDFLDWISSAVKNGRERERAPELKHGPFSRDNNEAERRMSDFQVNTRNHADVLNGPG